MLREEVSRVWGTEERWGRQDARSGDMGRESVSVTGEQQTAVMLLVWSQEGKDQ